jgi:hypothetical protein
LAGSAVADTVPVAVAGLTRSACTAALPIHAALARAGVATCGAAGDRADCARLADAIGAIPGRAFRGLCALRACAESAGAHAHSATVSIGSIEVAANQLDAGAGAAAIGIYRADIADGFAAAAGRGIALVAAAARGSAAGRAAGLACLDAVAGTGLDRREGFLRRTESAADCSGNASQHPLEH